MTPTLIHQIHLGGGVGAGIASCLRSVTMDHFSWSHILHNETTLEGMGVTHQVTPKLPNYACVTNRARLELLWKFGGIYLDTDVRSLWPYSCSHLLDYDNRAVAAIQDYDGNPAGRICNAIMSAPPRHPWIGWQLEHWNDFDQTDAASGVYLATAAPRDGLRLIPTERVYPYLWNTPPEERKTEGAVLEHKWCGSWTKEGK